MITKETLTEASIELSRIDRYFSKQWMDEDFPTDAVWELVEFCRNTVTKSPEEGVL